MAAYFHNPLISMSTSVISLKTHVHILFFFSSVIYGMVKVILKLSQQTSTDMSVAIEIAFWHQSIKRLCMHDWGMKLLVSLGVALLPYPSNWAKWYDNIPQYEDLPQSICASFSLTFFVIILNISIFKILLEKNLKINGKKILLIIILQQEWRPMNPLPWEDKAYRGHNFHYELVRDIINEPGGGLDVPCLIPRGFWEMVYVH